MNAVLVNVATVINDDGSTAHITECSLCGPVGVTLIEAAPEQVGRQHLVDHGVA